MCLITRRSQVQIKSCPRNQPHQVISPAQKAGLLVACATCKRPSKQVFAMLRLATLSVTGAIDPAITKCWCCAHDAAWTTRLRPFPPPLLRPHMPPKILNFGTIQGSVPSLGANLGDRACMSSWHYAGTRSTSRRAGYTFTDSRTGFPKFTRCAAQSCRRCAKVAREYPGAPSVFVTERGGSLTAVTVRKLVTSAGEAAGLPFPAHQQILRHACGYKLANEGHDTRSIRQCLGHRNIQHTVRYTELSPTRFKDFWRD